jgi:hypothetical protein
VHHVAASQLALHDIVVRPRPSASARYFGAAVAHGRHVLASRIAMNIAPIVIYCGFALLTAVSLVWCGCWFELMILWLG